MPSEEAKVAETDPNDPKEGRSTTPVAGVGLVFGAGLGTVVFALTQNPVWIGMSAGLGLVAGAILQTTRKR